MILSALLMLGGAVAAPQATTAATIGEAGGAALQGDVRHAMEILRPLDPVKLEEKDRQFLICMRERFAPGSVPGPAESTSFADRALALYRRYWHASLMHPENRDREEQRLAIEVGTLLHVDGKAAMDQLEPELARRLDAAGWHSLEGRTGLLRELMLWKKEAHSLADVALPIGHYQVNVAILNDFRSFGWAHYATCGQHATGGWATEQGLFAVEPRYPGLNSEEYRVRFLIHETQHFADKSQFEGLESWRLEYRAKLAELSVAQGIQPKLLSKFRADQGDDPASPHSFANRRVLAAIREALALDNMEQLFKADPARIRAAALGVLSADARSLARRPEGA